MPDGNEFEDAPTARVPAAGSRDAGPVLPGRYVDARLVARGGMGSVWRVRDADLGRDVAIKLLGDTAADEPVDVRRSRFEQEARTVARLGSHPHVVTIYDVGFDHDQPWLALEWMDGGTLADRMADARERPEVALGWLADVASALDAAHEAGVVHRDVKPANIMFGADGRARIGDFGIARWVADGQAALTQPGLMVGTMTYMSPEQARGEPAAPASDQYALACIAFELLTGRRPFARPEALAELAAHADAPIPSPHDLDPSLPAALDPAFEQALDKDPTRRFPSCSAAIAAIRSGLEGAPTRVAAAPVHGARPASRRADRRGVPVAAIVTAALVALAVAGAALATRGNDAEPRDDARAPAVESDQAADPQPEPRRDREPQPEPEPEPEPEPAADAEPTPPPSPERSQSEAIALHEESFRLLEAGRYAEAYAIAIDVVDDLEGISPWEAYSSYNVGASLVGLGRCEEAIPWLDRSERLQGQREEIDATRREAERCRDGEGGGKGDKGKGKGKGDDD